MAAADVSEPVKKKKVSKAYSVAGRPRQRGEYKCGRCGFFPKAAKHSCIEEKARMDEGRAALNAVKATTTMITVCELCIKNRARLANLPSVAVAPSPSRRFTRVVSAVPVFIFVVQASSWKNETQIFRYHMQ